MKETELYAPIVGGLLAENFLCFKIVDGSAGKKAFDICGITPDGKGLAVEVKLPKKYPEAVGVLWGIFQQHQVTWLRAYARQGAVALAAVYHEQKHELHVWKLRSAKDRCVRLPDLVLTRNSEKHFIGWSKLMEDKNGTKEN